VQKLWDWPVRLCHLIFIVGVFAAWLTYELGMMEWHKRNGYLLLGAVIFRILWGFTGSTSARFVHFLRGPRTVLHYILNWKSQPRAAGHNPLGGWAVVALLTLLLAQAATGLFTWTDNIFTDDFQAFQGPLAHLISTDLAKQITEIHEEVIFKLLLVVIAVHVLANIAYRVVKQQDLITPMITGRAPVDTTGLAQGNWRRLILCLGVAAAVVWRVATL
jgi:cytochrome b